MTKKRNIFIAALFTIAIGSAFTNKAENARFLGNWQKTATSCPSIPVICPFTSGVICTNIYLDNSCNAQAFKHS